MKARPRFTLNAFITTNNNSKNKHESTGWFRPQIACHDNTSISHRQDRHNSIHLFRFRFHGASILQNRMLERNASQPHKFLCIFACATLIIMAPRRTHKWGSACLDHTPTPICPPPPHRTKRPTHNAIILTSHTQECLDDPRRVRGDLALVHALVALVRVRDAQPPIIGILKFHTESRIAGVRLLADGQQIEAVVCRLALHPRHLHTHTHQKREEGEREYT